jgi:hypothetical protein
VLGVPILNRCAPVGLALGATVLLLMQLTGCASTPTQPHAAAAATPADQTALTVSAEVALKHGDCRTA